MSVIIDKIRTKTPCPKPGKVWTKKYKNSSKNPTVYLWVQMSKTCNNFTGKMPKKPLKNGPKSPKFGWFPLKFHRNRPECPDVQNLKNGKKNAEYRHLFVRMSDIWEPCSFVYVSVYPDVQNPFFFVQIFKFHINRPLTLYISLLHTHNFLHRVGIQNSEAGWRQ